MPAAFTVTSFAERESSRASAIRSGVRRRTERYLELARHLDASDRALVEQVLSRNVSVADLARAAGVSPRALQRRLRAVLEHLRDPLFRFAIEQPDLVPVDARTSVHLWVRTRASRATLARRLGISYHAVRTQLRDTATLARLWGYRSSAGA